MGRLLGTLLVATCLGSAVATADPPERFMLDDTADLVALCEVEPGASAERDGLVFCHGFVVGTVHYHLASTQADGPRRWVCLPPLEVRPSRDLVIREFVEWAKEHPEFMRDEAVDGLFRFLDERFPCS